MFAFRLYLGSLGAGYHPMMLEDADVIRRRLAESERRTDL
jgi:hypothetical protein